MLNIQPTGHNLVPQVLKQTPQGERGYDLFSRLLEDRIIFINGPVDHHMSESICAQLLYLDAIDEDSRDIRMYINSPGGVVTDGLAMYDTMQYIRSDVSTIIMGQAASMGSFLGMAGAKGKRFALPHARIMIHQPSAGTQGQVTDMEIHVAESARLKKILTGKYAEHCDADYDTFHGLMERDKFLSPQDAKELGLIDDIVEKMEH